jgi:EmrB/QacA subfamily drug resistance transporter
MAQNKWWTLAAVCTATFMLLIDVTVVNVALPEISRDLDASFTDLQWVVDAYALGLAALLLTAGSLGDRLGRRLIFVAGLVLFVIASIACGVAPSPTFLNVARGIQGIGAAAMFATSLALLAGAFQGRERGTAIGIWGATIGGAVAVGPLVGGALTDGLGWEFIFFVNVPIGALAIAMTLRFVAESRDPTPGGIDWAGLVLFSTALFLLVFALVRGNAEGWGSGLIVAFLLWAGGLLLLFVWVERRREHPMLDLTLFRLPTFTGAAIAAFCLSASAFSMFLYQTLFIQNQLGYKPFNAGLVFLPTTLVSFFVAPISGRLSERIEVRWLFGAGLLLVGIGLLLQLPTSPGSDWTVLLPGFLVAGVGVGLANPAIATTAVGVVHAARSGMASGINSTFRQVGIATGIAGLGAVFQSQIASETIARLPAGAERFTGTDEGALGERLSSVALTAVPDPFQDAVNAGFVASFDHILLVSAIVALAGAVLSFVLVRQRDFVVPPGH